MQYFLYISGSAHGSKTQRSSVGDGPGKGSIPAVSVLTSRKASSTPSLTDVVTDTGDEPSVACTDQAASADNLAAKVRTRILKCCKQL